MVSLGSEAVEKREQKFGNITYQVIKLKNYLGMKFGIAITNFVALEIRLIEKYQDSFGETVTLLNHLGLKY